MGAPRLLPKGADRTWTRAFYYAINRIMRRMWHEQHADEQITRAIRDMMTVGRGYIRTRE